MSDSFLLLQMHLSPHATLLLFPHPSLLPSPGTHSALSISEPLSFDILSGVLFPLGLYMTDLTPFYPSGFNSDVTASETLPSTLHHSPPFAIMPLIIKFTC